MHGRIFDDKKSGVSSHLSMKTKKKKKRVLVLKLVNSFVLALLQPLISGVSFS